MAIITGFENKVLIKIAPYTVFNCFEKWFNPMLKKKYVGSVFCMYKIYEMQENIKLSCIQTGYNHITDIFYDCTENSEATSVFAKTWIKKNWIVS